jgi:hypothetical protein
MSLLATCALAISLPSFNDFEMISTASARPVAGSPPTTVPAYKVSSMTTSVAFENRKLDHRD